MGRPNSTNDNLPPYMRKRVRKYGTYYFLDTGAKPRSEIPLGTDYFAALRKYAEFMDRSASGDVRTFGDAINRYRLQELPNKAQNTIRVMMTDLRYLESYFGEAPMEEIRPMHIRMFLDKHRDKPTTANRCKRVFSAVWNVARGWGFTDLPSPSAGIMGYSLGKREVYITDEVYNAVRNASTEELRNAMDLAYLTGQRPSDALRMTEDDIVSGFLIVSQGKTHKKLRIVVTGELAALLGRIATRKAQYRVTHRHLLMNRRNAPLTQAVLRRLFKNAKGKAVLENPSLASAIQAFWFYDLRAKAADDVGDERGAQDATDLLGHDSPRTTSRHYRRRGTIVRPTR
jgi:integrase